MGSGAQQILTVIGPARATRDEKEAARRVGELAAEHGWALLTGGGAGVMAAACLGAAAAGGVTIGILPTENASEGYPNRWVQLRVYTGLGSGRNVINVLSADLCLAIGGGPGTLSEIALALKNGREVWAYNSWELEPPASFSGRLPRAFASLDELLDALRERLR